MVAKLLLNQESKKRWTTYTINKENTSEQGGEVKSEVKGDTQGDTQGRDLDEWIEYKVTENPKITTEELAHLSSKSIITIKRRIAKMPHIEYVGSGYSGHWEVKKK